MAAPFGFLLKTVECLQSGRRGLTGSAPGFSQLPGEGSGRGEGATDRDGGGSASVSGKDKGEWGEGGELVAFSDLKFSRVIGEVCPATRPLQPCQGP